MLCHTGVYALYNQLNTYVLYGNSTAAAASTWAKRVDAELQMKTVLAFFNKKRYQRTLYDI